MEERLTLEQLGAIDAKTLASVFRTSKKTIQEYIAEIERHCRYKTMRADSNWDTILDDRSRLIDLYESCIQQDAHLRGTIEGFRRINIVVCNPDNVSISSELVQDRNLEIFIHNNKTLIS